MTSKTQLARQAFEGAGARFILAELDLAITFCQIGLTSRSTAHAIRNALNAERALDAVTRMKKRIRLNEVEEQEVASKTFTLSALLEQLKNRLVSANAGDADGSL
jgi:hypothetical protein